MRDALLSRPPRPRSDRWSTARRFARNKGAVGGVMVLAFILAAVGLAPVLAPYDPIALNTNEVLALPGARHLMGTDDLGRDVFSRILYGGLLSLSVGVMAVSIAGVSGTLLGLIAGYYNGWIEQVIMRITDVMLAFPGILLAMLVVATLGPSLTNIMIALAFSRAPAYARLVRGSVLAMKQNLFVEAAVVRGCTHNRILFRHILPNVMVPILVVASLDVGVAIIVGASLSFLGLGAQPPTPEWGRMLSDARRFLRVAPWLSMFPGLAIMLTVLAANLVGDGLRTALDPRLRV
ncbi:MAG: ABC transporter permease [Chloroflexi bacterium]|nr:ABC transporter permease [Chloroflexota bacterium]